MCNIAHRGFARFARFSAYGRKSSRQRAMLGEKSLPKFYRIGDKVSAHELYFGTKPNLRHLRVFSSIAYVHVLKEKGRKLDAKAEKCIFVGYSDEQKGYKCYNPCTKQARVSRNVVFDESASWYLPPTLRAPTPIRALTMRSARPRCLRMTPESRPRVRFHFG